MGTFDHVQIKVASLQGSRGFYEAIFRALGYGIVFEIEDVVLGFGDNIHERRTR